MAVSKTHNQWFIRVSLPCEAKGMYKAIIFKCGDDEKEARENEQKMKKKFGNKIETEIYFGNLASRYSNN